MSIEQAFMQATRTKLRFASTRGLLSVEDLWDLPLTSTKNQPNLDSIAVDLYTRMQGQPTISFVTTKALSSPTDELALDIVKYIISVRMEENKLKLASAQAAQKKQQLLSIMERKQNEQLEGLSLADLQAAIEAL
jgi:hypothetical protein